MTILERGVGMLVWRDYDEYLVVGREEIKLKEISKGSEIISFPTDVFISRRRDYGEKSSLILPRLCLSLFHRYLGSCRYRYHDLGLHL